MNTNSISVPTAKGPSLAGQRFTDRLFAAEDQTVARIASVCFHSHCGIYPPYSYILTGLKEFILFLRQNVAEKLEERKMLSEFEVRLNNVWKKILGIDSLRHSPLHWLR